MCGAYKTILMSKASEMMQQDLTYFHIIIIHYLIIYSLIE